MKLNLNNEQKSQFNQDGFLILDQLIDPERLPILHQAFDDLFDGQFETGVQPDEINWQSRDGRPDLTRQICNGWKANRNIAKVALSESIGKAIATLAGWSGVRVMIDNVIWKPPGAKSLGYHQDSAFLAWYQPSDLLTCWIALDDTRAEGGTIEFIKGSHQWALSPPEGEFHAPDNYREPMLKAAQKTGVDPEIVY
ncbi:MAG: ectoine hydroxylase-related dioxygenase (phytanoyl-CoA dioxygenase family), partial [Gammaproteobacteria bacterium]